MQRFVAQSYLGLKKINNVAILKEVKFKSLASVNKKSWQEPSFLYISK